MPEKKTLYVVGAGASYEVGLPLGVHLKAEIARVLKFRIDDFGRINEGNEDISRAFSILAARKGNSSNINPYLQAAIRIGDAMPQAISIDNFIDANNDDK